MASCHRSWFRLFAAFSIALAATAGFAQTSVTLDATSGTGTISTNYTTTGGLTLSNGFFAEYLVLAGGGGGGGSANDGTAWGGGGGGAGGLRTGTTQLISGTSYTVQVGGGGAGGLMTSTQANQQGSNGANSIFGSVTAAGGGGGGRYKQQGNAGGSGGGGGGRNSTAGGAGNTPSTTPSQGNSGGNARGGDDSGRSGGGGGGGAGGAGGNGAPTSSTAGNGGIGSVSTITGSSVTYAGGGGGGAIDTNSGAGETAGTGGTGGGGNGSTSGNATAGTDGLGGGGGGVGNNGAGGSGGAGQVIVRYQGASLGNIGGTVTSGSGSAAGSTLHTFTTTGTTTGTSALNFSGVDMNARLGATLTGTLSGSGGMTFAGPGRLTLSASNSFTGDTRISSGTLAIGNTNALAGSTLDMNSGDSGAITFAQASNLGGLTGSRALSNGGNALTIGGNNSTTTYSGNLSGVGGLTKNGTGVLTLSGSNSFTGDTRISSGTLAIGNANALAGSTLDMNSGDSGAITFSQASNLGGLTGSRALSNGGNSLTIGGNNASTTYSGNLSGAGGLTKNGTGSLTLSANSSFTGDTRISSGTLAIGHTNALAGSTLDMNANDSGTITFNQFSILGGLAGTRNLSNGGKTLSIGYNEQSTTYSGVLSGSGGLIKIGDTSSLTLSASNSFTGDTRISSGTLAIGNANALAGSTLDMNTGDSGAVTFSQFSNLGGLKGSRDLSNGGKWLTIGGNNSTTTYSGNLSGAGGLTKNGTGVLTLSASNSFTGDTRISSGTLAIGNADALAGSTLNMYSGDSGAITFSQTSNLGGLTGFRDLSNGGNSLAIGGNNSTTVYSGVLSGSGGLTKQGTGSLILTGNNTYTGLTTVSSGTLSIGGGGATGAIAGDIANSGAVVFNRYDAVSYAGTISGTGSLTKLGSGTLTLTGNNSFTGDTRITAGILAVGNANALAGSTLDMNAGMVTFSQASNIGSLKGSQSINNNGYTLTIGGNNASTSYSGALSASGGLTKSGTGTLTLSGVNYFTGDTRITLGTLAVSDQNGLYNSTLDMNASDSGAIVFSQNSNIGGLKGSRDLANGGNSLTIGGNNSTTTYSGGLSGGGGLNKNGFGTLTLSGSNSFTGDTRIMTGTLVVGNANALAGSTLDFKDADYGATSFSQASNIGGLKGRGKLRNGGHTLTIGGNNQSTSWAGIIIGSGGLTKSGTGTLTLSEYNVFSGDTRITLGTLAVSDQNGLSNSTLDMNASDSGAISFSKDSNLGGLKGSRDLANGGRTLTIGYNNASTTYSGGLSGSGGLTKTGSGTLTLSGNNTYTGLTTIATGTLSVGDGGTSGSLTSGIQLSGSQTALIFNRSDASTYGGNIAGTGSLTKLGAGALTLTGSNTFKGQTTVSAGTLVLGSGNALSKTAAVTVASGATLEATTPIRIGYIDSQGTVVGGENLSATLTVTRSGNIGGIANGSDSQGTFAAGIAKLGTGTSTVNQANTYTGLTWVREGTLALGVSNAFAAASDLTVDSGATIDRAGFSQTVTDAVINGSVANTGGGGVLTVTGTLSGSGILNGNVTVAGVHAPGNSPGIQTITGDLTYGNAAAINWELTDNTASNSPVVFDQIILTGTSNLAFNGANVLTLSFAGAGSLVDWNNSFWDVNRAWTVFDLATGVTTGFGSLSLGGSLLDANGLALDAGGRGSFSLGQSGQDVLLVFTAVPEPSTYCMALVGLACGGYSLFRRRKRA